MYVVHRRIYTSSTELDHNSKTIDVLNTTRSMIPPVDVFKVVIADNGQWNKMGIAM